MVAPLTVAVSTAALGGLLGMTAPRLAYRLSRPAGAPARSACQRCARPFPRDLSGWVRPGARCPGCATRLGPHAGLTAFTGASSFGLLTAALLGDPALIACLAMAAIGVPLAFVDLACRRLPDPLVAAAALAGLVGLSAAAVELGAADPLLRAFVSALGCFAGYVLLALLPAARLGFGDVKLAGVLGLPLGWFGWDTLLLGLVLPHLINGSVALALLLTGRAGRRTALPFGPALLTGALLAIGMTKQPLLSPLG